MSRAQDPVSRGLLTELAKEEATLAGADSKLKEARARFDVASWKYAAVRDMVTRHLGDSPYSKGHGLWPQEAIGTLVKTRGCYRFIHMRVGDAVVAALKEVKEPMALEHVVQRLADGGIRISPLLLRRSVNAALMRTTGVEKTDDGKYRYQEPEPEDLPFD